MADEILPWPVHWRAILTVVGNLDAKHEKAPEICDMYRLQFAVAKVSTVGMTPALVPEVELEVEWKEIFNLDGRPKLQRNSRIHPGKRSRRMSEARRNELTLIVGRSCRVARMPGRHACCPCCREPGRQSVEKDA